ncbi:hypothetical protein P9112_002569 [Eukaryota sp. TZLM1-RC]
MSDHQQDWGRKKSSYYQGNADAEMSSSDEDPEELEAIEAARIREQQVSMLDDDDFEPIALVSKSSLSASNSTDHTGTAVLPTTSTSQEPSFKESDALELPKLLASLKSNLVSTRQRVAELLKEAKLLREHLDKSSPHSEDLEQGISLLTTKYHLLLNYCMNCTFYLLLKIRNKPVANHPVVKQLITLRLYLERTIDLESRVKHTINRILGASKHQSTEEHLKPNPDAMIEEDEMSQADSDLDDVSNDEGSSEVYRPPRISGMELMEQEKQELLEKQQQARVRKSKMFKELSYEFTEAPEEVESLVNIDREALAADLEHEAAEEELMTRVNKGKKKKRVKNGLEGVTNMEFTDDLADLLEEESNLIDGTAGKKRQFSQLLGSKSKKPNLNPDADLPYSEPRSLKQSRIEEGDLERFGGFSDNEEGKLDDVDDELSDIEDDLDSNYTPQLPEMDQEADGRRKTSWEINKNKGLTAHHSKASRNPRVKYRGQYDKKKKKSDSGKRRVKGDRSNYSGESGSIKKNVKRSRKI